MFRYRFALLFIGALLATVPNGRADNESMMKAHGRHLLEINEDVIREIPNLRPKSKVILRADVVDRDGHSEIRIGSIQIVSDGSDDGVSTEPPQASSRKAKSNDSSGSNAQKAPGPDPETNSSGHSAYGNTTDSNPEVRVLTDEETSKLDWKGEKRPSKAVLLYWSD